MALLYINRVPSSLRSQFESEVISLCRELGIANPDWLMLVIKAESNFVTTAKNPNGSATGLIQFIASTATWIGTSVDALRKMNHLEQLKWVKEYLKRLIAEKGKPNNAYDLYFLVHSKKGFGKSDEYIMYVKGSDEYAGNSSLDYNKDNKVLVAEIKEFLDNQLPLLYNKENLYRADSTIIPSTGSIVSVVLVGMFGSVVYFLVFKNGFRVLKALVFRK